ncbi:hypothetical protein GI374_00925 [Paracoccus sp. S-4012]|uniref:hypothetical protein n=1 Tax=Paracoccus sp. S-4012 TaxID=2665648 RepID=UPI0012AF8078|nr:hypothetical protein [Paracoccus sp. S-4012]MRX49020.1 hypothetical protein [Paracoccus sp. S-4012]
MSGHLGALVRARKALLEGRPQDCEREILAFEAFLETAPAPAAERERCVRLVRELHGLAQACAEGAASACRTFAEALEAAGQLTTYDSGGARAHRQARPRPGRAF